MYAFSQRTKSRFERSVTEVVTVLVQYQLSNSAHIWYSNRRYLQETSLSTCQALDAHSHCDLASDQQQAALQ
jgi:hypothetical protein